MRIHETLLIFPVLFFPGIGDFKEIIVSVLSDKQCRFFVFPIFIGRFTVKALDCITRGIAVTICTGVMAFPDAAYFHFTSGFSDIPFAIFITDLASPAPDIYQLSARLAICSATSNFRDRHIPLLKYVLARHDYHVSVDITSYLQISCKFI